MFVNKYLPYKAAFTNFSGVVWIDSSIPCPAYDRLVVSMLQNARIFANVRALAIASI